MDTIVPQDDQPYKMCSNPDCKNPWLPATTEYFYSHNEGKGGLRPDCKVCWRARVKARKLAHYEEYLARTRAYNQAHAAEKCAKQQAYQQAHPEQRRQWLDSHADELRAYRQRTAHILRANVRNRYARLKGNGGTHTAQDVQAQYQRQKGKCYYCKVKVGDRYHVDHVVPLSRGGSNDPSNLVIACPTCNQSKNDRLPHEWPKGGRLL